MKLFPITLAIDTSCDETAAAVTCGLEVWSNIVASQTELHKPYGGVFPTVAKLAHQENIEKTVVAALQRGHIQPSEIEQIAVTIGPGLAPALEVGIGYAQKLAKELDVPLIPINHVEAHLLSCHVLQRPINKWQGLTIEKKRAGQHTQQYWQTINLPALGIIVSGKHTAFVQVGESGRHTEHSRSTTPFDSVFNCIQPDIAQGDSATIDRIPGLRLNNQDNLPWLNSKIFHYTILGQTVDDAAGEALDKLGRLLNLGYPAGPVIEELAKKGNAKKYPLPLPMTESKNFNLSFSGLKTYTRNFIEKEWGKNPPNKQEVYDLAASIQYAVFRHICNKLDKIILAKKTYSNFDQIWLGGGVAANATLRSMLRQTLKKNKVTAKLLTPANNKLCGDNAGMIGIVAAPTLT